MSEALPCASPATTLRSRVESSGGLGDVGMMEDQAPFLRPTWFLDSDSAPVRELAERAVGDRASDIDKAVALYYAIRDGIRYDPYAMSADPHRYRASTVATLPAAYCIQKSTLMAAAARAVGVPSRLGFADVRNHLTSPKLREAMGSDVFVYHGFTELFLDGQWVKATPVFNLSLCERFGVRPLEFERASRFDLPSLRRAKPQAHGVRARAAARSPSYHSTRSWRRSAASTRRCVRPSTADRCATRCSDRAPAILSPKPWRSTFGAGGAPITRRLPRFARGRWSSRTPHDPYDCFAATVSDLAYDLYVAYDGGTPIGMVAVSYVRALPLGGQRAMLEELVVHPGRRGRGSAGGFSSSRSRRARRRGVRAFEARPTDEAAERFLDHVGFRAGGRRYARSIGEESGVSERANSVRCFGGSRDRAHGSDP